MTNARETGSSHIFCSGDCDPCARALEFVRRQDEVFVAMCEKAEKMEAELRQFKPHATAIEEELLEMRRERFLRPLRPNTAVGQNTQTGAGTVRSWMCRFGRNRPMT